jgi:hypothetical protein
MEFKEKHSQMVSTKISQDFEIKKSQDQEPEDVRSIVNELML